MSEPPDWEKGKRVPTFNKAANPPPQDKSEQKQAEGRPPPKFPMPRLVPRGPMSAVRDTVDRSVNNRQQKLQKAAEEMKKVEEKQRDMLKSRFNDKGRGD